MKKILLILCLFPILVFSQKSYKIPADSTILNNIGSGKNELVIRNATSNITGGVLTNLGNGVTAFVLGGNSARVVDTIYKNSAKDSIVFTISGIRYAVKDSFNLNTDSQTLSISNDTLTISGGNNVVLPFIPLSGTVSGSPVTGDIEFYNAGDDANAFIKYNATDGLFMFGTDGSYVSGASLHNKDAGADDYISVNADKILVESANPTYKGIGSNSDYTANITDLDYTQKIYVDNAISSNRKVDTSYIFRNSTLDSLCQITVINGISYRSCGKDSVGAGSSTLALDKITDAVDSSTLNAGNYKQEWKWNSLANNTGFKLSSSSGGSLNTVNKLFECELTGAMPGTGNSSYAGYFKNTQTYGGSTGLYAEGVNNSILASGSINITSGSLQLGGSSGGLFYRQSGNTFLQASNSQGLVLQSSNGVAYIYCGSNELGLIVSRKTLNQRYVLGIGGSLYQSSAYLSVFTTATLIERDLGKLIFSANTGLAGGYASFTPNNVMTINGGATEATSNVGIGTTSPVASAKLEVSSTTSGFLPPRMTATQASAISTPAQGLLLFVTDTDGTFTSVGWWGYNGATWEKLNN